MSCDRMAGNPAVRACRRNHRLNRFGWMGVPPGMVKARPLSAYCGPAASRSSVWRLWR